MNEVVSIVVPAFNEAGKIARAIRRIAEYCESRGIQGELIVVDDGSSDSTAAEAENAPHGSLTLRVFRERVNHGKGHAVRTGVVASTGSIVLFTDTDLSVPLEESDKLFERLAAGADVAIGSRRLQSSPLWRFVPVALNGTHESSIKVHQPFYRELFGEIYHRFVGVFLGIPVRDVNCGFKCFRGDVARRLFRTMTVERWGFDAEILLIAQRCQVRIDEVEVDWYNNPASKVNMFTAPFSSFAEVCKIKMNDVLGHYAAAARSEQVSSEQSTEH